MHKSIIAAFLVVVGCTVAGPRKPNSAAPTAIPAEASAHPLTAEEEGRILLLEDRRQYDPATVAWFAANPNPPHRARIARALGHIGPQTFVDANGNGERDPGERQAGVTELLGLVQDPEADVRTSVAFALGEIGDASAVEALFQLANDSNATVAAEAAEALSKMAKQIPIARFGALTNSGAEGSRARAVRFLFRFDSDEASAIAGRLLEEPSAELRREAAYALSRRPYAPARERLELLTGDADVLTRAYAAAALGRIGAADSMPALARALGDVHPWVRTNAVVAVSRIAAKNTSALAAAEIPRILALTEDPDPGTRAATIDALGFYARVNEAARKRLLDIAVNGSRAERELAAGAIAQQFGDSEPALIPSELSDWAKVRVIGAAGQLKTNTTMLLRRFANDPSPMVRANLLGAISAADVDALMDLIRSALDDPDVFIRASAIQQYAQSKADPEAVRISTLENAAERARADSEPDARLSAVSALASIDYPGREPLLRSLIADRNPVVRRVAADLIEGGLKKNRPQFTPLPIDRPLSEYEAIAAWSQAPHTATIHMTRGNIVIVLLPKDAPMTTWNFAQLAGRKYFDNTTFMRVVPNFVIQGGDPRNDQNGGPGYSIRDEINLQKYTRGAVGMALAGPDTGGSQFFITHSPQPHLDGGYTIFGRVTEGMTAVLDQTERGDLVETITIDEQH